MLRSGQHSTEFILKCAYARLYCVDLFIAENDIYLHIYIYLYIHAWVCTIHSKEIHTCKAFGLLVVLSVPLLLMMRTQPSVHRANWRRCAHTHTRILTRARAATDIEWKTFLAFLRNSQSQSFWFHLLLLRHSLFRTNYLFMTITYVIVMPSWCWNKFSSSFVLNRRKKRQTEEKYNGSKWVWQVAFIMLLLYIYFNVSFAFSNRKKKHTANVKWHFFHVYVLYSMIQTFLFFIQHIQVAEATSWMESYLKLNANERCFYRKYGNWYNMSPSSNIQMRFNNFQGKACELISGFILINTWFRTFFLLHVLRRWLVKKTVAMISQAQKSFQLFTTIW